MAFGHTLFSRVLVKPLAESEENRFAPKNQTNAGDESFRNLT